MNENIFKEIEIINLNFSKIEKIKKFIVIDEQFTIENGLMTPTLKLKRYKIIQKYKNKIEKLEKTRNNCKKHRKNEQWTKMEN